MAIIINGKEYHGNVKIVNGQEIEGESFDGTATQKIDQTKRKVAAGIRKIYINSDINVKVSACDTDYVTAHLHGSAVTSDDLHLTVESMKDTIRIDARSANRSVIVGGSIIVGNYNVPGSSNLALDVLIPAREFKKLCINTQNARIDVDANVKADSIFAASKNGSIDISAAAGDLTIESRNGKIDVLSVFRSLNIRSQNGSIDVDSEASSDIIVNIESQNGSVDVNLDNIGVSKIVPYTKNGSIKNKPRGGGIYTVIGYVSSINRSIKIR